MSKELIRLSDCVMKYDDDIILDHCLCRACIGLSVRLA